MPDGRVNNGGARVGAGRPSKTDENAKIELIRSVIVEEEVIELCAKQAKKGNIKAIELLMHYLLGKPKDTVKIDQEGNDNVPIVTWVKKSS